MKKIMMMAFATAISLCAQAQNISQSTVPAAVINVFKQQFPKASDIEWEKKADLYEVEFETGAFHRDHTVLMDAAGKVISHAQDISEKEIPEVVIIKIRQTYDGYKIEDPEKFEANGATTYKVELKKPNEEWKVTYAANGTLLEKVPG